MAGPARTSVARVRAVAGKELLDFVRDWRTLLAVILIPFLIFPAMFILLPLVLANETAELAELELDIALQIDADDPVPVNLTNQFAELGLRLQAETTEALTADQLADLTEAGDDLERIRDGELEAILRLDRNGTDPEAWRYVILHQSTDERSAEANRRVQTALIIWERSLIDASLMDAGLEPNATLDPVQRQVDEDGADGDLASSGEQLAFLASLFIPLVLTLWTATSAIQPAIDLTAGERERGTLEALLTTPAGRLELLYGKWLAVASIAGLGVVVQVGGLVFSMAFLLSGSGADLGLPSFDLLSVLLLFLAVLVFAISVVAIELAIAMRSHSVREAGSVLGPLVFVFVLPAMFAQFINLDGIEWWWFVIPVVNVLLAMRELLLGTIDLSHSVLWVGSSLAYAVGAAWYASRQFGREDLVESIS